MIGNQNTGQYMNLSQNDAYMHVVVYKYNDSYDIFIKASNCDAYHLDGRYLNAYYNHSVTRTYLDGSTHSIVNGPITITTSDISPTYFFGVITSLRIDYNNYYYIRN